MHKKRYGKLTVNAWLNCELERSSPIFMLVCGILFAVGGILVRAFVGSPYRVMLELGIKDMIPPVWLMTFLWSIAFFVAGCAFGFVLCYRWAGCEAEKYKGCMVFVLMAVLELCWYPTLFGADLIFLSAIEVLLIFVASLAVTFSFYRVTKLAGMLMLFHSIWLVYMLILNFAILFRG